MLNFLLLCIALASVMQPTAARVVTSLAYFSPTLMHFALLNNESGIAYYGSAAMADNVALMLINLLVKPSRLSFELSKVCIISVVLNLVGWVLYMTYNKPYFYNVGMVALYVYVVWLLVVGGVFNDRLGVDRVARGGSDFRAYYHSCINTMGKNKK